MSIVLEQITKRYEGQPVVNRVSLDIPEGEFFVLIGPSGSGKSTVLRMIAGLNVVDQGRVLLHGRDVTTAPPQQRGVGFVFQHYALFRHMSVADNIEFALRVRRVAPAARQRRRDELLELVGLAGLGRRMPAQLSGGQQQRVALARALAHQPEVLLLDEPFGALDAKIRVDLRRALRDIQSRLGITTIFVTHDQDEAFELADRLGVMNFGRLLEVGPPAELYQRPQTEFVATFLGTGSLLAGQCIEGEVQVGPLRFPLTTQVPPGLAAGPEPVHVLFRPEDVVLASNAATLDAALFSSGKVESISFSGSFERVRVRLPAMPAVRAIAPPVSYGHDSFQVDALRTLEQARQAPLADGASVWVGIRRIHALAYPGLSFLIMVDGSPLGQAALSMGGQMARLAHARVTLLGFGQPPAAKAQIVQAAREALGSGLAALETRSTPDPLVLAAASECERNGYDVIVSGCTPATGPALVERLLEAGPKNLLLVPQVAPIPVSALVSITESEHGKQDVLVAGPLLHAMGAEATLLCIVPEADSDSPSRKRVERFLIDGARTLEAMGVTVRTVVGAGPVVDAIRRQMDAGGHDLLVLGAPLADRSGRVAMSSRMRQVLEAAPRHPILIVRSRYAADVGPQRTFDGRIVIIEEVTP